MSVSASTTIVRRSVGRHVRNTTRSVGCCHAITWLRNRDWLGGGIASLRRIIRCHYQIDFVCRWWVCSKGRGDRVFIKEDTRRWKSFGNGGNLPIDQQPVRGSGAESLAKYGLYSSSPAMSNYISKSTGVGDE